MPEIRIFDAGGLKKNSVKEQIMAAIDYCDPKLVQIVLGPRYCQLWQYWLVRALFNYDMLSMSKLAKCELPLQIAHAELEYLKDKKTVNVEELVKIQQEENNKISKKIEQFYGRERLSQLCSLENERTPGTDVMVSEQAINQFTANCMQKYQELNKDCSVVDSLDAAFNTDFTAECKLMVKETMNECKKDVSSGGTVLDIQGKLNEKICKLETNKRNVLSKIDQVENRIIRKMQDNKFLDKDFLREEFSKLLDHYFNVYASNIKNPLHNYTKSDEIKIKAKKHFLDQAVSYGFGDYIHHAVSKYKEEKDQDKKETYLDIVRVLAINGAHSESLVVIFDTPELKDIALQSIFTVARRAYNVLFDFDRSDIAKLMSRIVGVDGKFADPKNQNVHILGGESGSPLIRTALGNLKRIEKEFQDKRERGKANRDAGFFNGLFYIISDFYNETLLGKSYTPNTKLQHESVYEILYETLELTYLALATGDDKVLIDYAKDIELRKKKEKNLDVRAVYDILHSIFNKFEISKCEGRDEFGRWNRFWYYFTDIVKVSDDIRKDSQISTLSVALYVSKAISNTYDQHQKQRFVTEFKNINIEILPGNCLINWLGATYGSVQRAKEKEAVVTKKQTDEALKRAEFESKRADEESKKATRLKLENEALRTFYAVLKRLKLSTTVQDDLEDKVDEILRTVVDNVLDYSFTLETAMEDEIKERIP